VRKKLVEMVSKRIRGLRVGYQLEETSDLGPLVSQQQMEKVLEYVAAAFSEGLNVVTGGRRLSGGVFDRGFYVEPTLVDETPPTSKLFREEIFGPV
jgi:acyl-CoA reductase-like NAD-dependent aldehyde dehydrogenase